MQGMANSCTVTKHQEGRGQGGEEALEPTSKDLHPLSPSLTHNWKGHMFGLHENGNSLPHTHPPPPIPDPSREGCCHMIALGEACLENL